MDIAADARCLNRIHIRGIGKYLREVVARTARLSGARWTLLADRPDLPFHRPSGEGTAAEVFASHGHRLHAWEQVALPRRVRRIAADVMHCPSGLVPWWQPVPTVVTIHDAVPWLEDDPGLPRGWYTDRMLPKAFRKCSAIITDSECSRRDITRLWPDLELKLRVIPLGVGDSYLKAVPDPPGKAMVTCGVSPPYLLYVGGSISRKRLDWALRVFEGVDDRRVSLVVCGVEAAAHEQIRASVRPEIRPRLLFAPFVPEEEMPGLYQNAVATLYPTLYEGFGLPAVESQAVGTPVLLSPLGSLAEVIGPGAVVLEPEALSDWIEACRGLLSTRGEHPQTDEQSRAWARRFSWDVCAERHLEVYRSVTRRGRGERHVSSAMSALHRAP